MVKTVNIQKFFNKYNIEYYVVSGGKEFTLNCLYHEDKKHKLSINSTSGLWHCWSCGEAGSFRDLVRKISSSKKKDINYKDFEGGSFKTPEVVSTEEKIPWPEGYNPFSNSGGIIETKAKEYLLNRNITEDQIAYYKIGYCSFGKYSGRVIVPVFNDSNNLVSFIARDYTGVLKPKVLTPPSITGKHGVKDFIFNLNNASKLGQLYIGEGVFDSISLGVCGVALFGKRATNIQLSKLINKKPKKIIICLDPDARFEAELLGHQLTGYIENVSIARLPEGVDPNSISKVELEKVIKEAKPAKAFYEMDFI